MIYLIFRTILVKLLEPIYFSLFLIMAKDIKHKRILFTLTMIFEYLMLKSFIHYNVWFQLSYTFMTYINLKVFYKDKAQITDIFLFAFASLALIAISLISYFVVYFTIGIYDIALVLNRIMLFAFLFITKDIIRNTYTAVIEMTIEVAIEIVIEVETIDVAVEEIIETIETIVAKKISMNV